VAEGVTKEGPENQTSKKKEGREIMKSLLDEVGVSVGVLPLVEKGRTRGKHAATAIQEKRMETGRLRKPWTAFGRIA